MAKDTHELQVGSKVWKLGDSQKGIEEFQLIMCSQFYFRDSRTLTQAKKTTPRIVEKMKETLKYMFITYSCVYGGQSFKNRPTTGTRPQQMCFTSCFTMYKFNV